MITSGTRIGSRGFLQEEIETEYGNEEEMEEKKYFKWNEFLSYYKPFKGIFAADMFFAFLGAATTLVIPLIVRYITGTVVYMPKEQILSTILVLGAVMTLLVLIQCGSNYFIGNYGHVMGAKIEYNMRKEIFEHYQKDRKSVV